MSTIDLACLVSHPIQYQAPLFREINQRDGVNLTVYFCSTRGLEAEFDEGFGEKIEWDVPLLEGYDSKFLKDISPLGGADSLFRFNPGIVQALQKNDYDAIWVHGYDGITNIAAIVLSEIQDVPVILRGEGNLIGQQKSGVNLKRSVLSKLFSHVAAFAYIGTKNKQFYQEYGVPEKKLFFAPYTVHNEFFQNQREKLPDRAQLRAEENIPSDVPVVLFVGKLIERKRPSHLLDAFCDATDNGEAHLVFVGDGNQRTELESSVPSNRTSDVTFAGFVNQTQLPRFYKLSDVFCLPSGQENWGLVVNEAMNFGLPIIATEVVGSTIDLVDEENGQVVPVDDVRELSKAISATCQDDNRKQMSSKSKERIEEWSISKTADGVLNAVNAGQANQGNL